MATCTVSGVIKDSSETAIQSVIVKARIVTPFFVSTVLIVPKELSTTSDANGAWSLVLTRSKSYIVTFEYSPNSTDSKKIYAYAITTPASSTSDFSTLATEL